jgi:FPC/CPF motif-containing protein YcgG
MTAIGSALEKNPFGGSSNNSSYMAWRDEKVVSALDAKQQISPLAERVHGEFRSFVLDSEFPCVGAKAAINGNCYRFGFYEEMNLPTSNHDLAHDLWEYTREQASFDSHYSTFVASFAAPRVEDENAWEKMLWAQLQSLNELDSQFHEWSPKVSGDPNEPGFAFSFAETAFFIVGLHPASSRLSRRFGWATLVFNLHEQFERLRDENKFERMRETIRMRDLRLQGSLNPNLSDFGKKSDARQYSGRAVEANWKCPFHRLVSGKKD